MSLLCTVLAGIQRRPEKTVCLLKYINMVPKCGSRWSRLVFITDLCNIGWREDLTLKREATSVLCFTLLFVVFCLDSCMSLLFFPTQRMIRKPKIPEHRGAALAGQRQRIITELIQIWTAHLHVKRLKSTVGRLISSHYRTNARSLPRFTVVMRQNIRW